MSDRCRAKKQSPRRSGDSGAGKTESARHMMLYLRYVSNTSPELETRLYGSDPITEGFGAAPRGHRESPQSLGRRGSRSAPLL